ncbi:hypothetical protein EDB81DRAFT_916564 [Dactylonectria macrodidyma]|uniref:Uncharacterized protein n=1 Tax=Dactylonectria macrodidyma TaxID=307937 RepID=A0A9P9DBU3_9HYPO|nr:hypothetical protein EDB81DRAFT_916564 [Dactylonectria macrodidyma]
MYGLVLRRRGHKSRVSGIFNKWRRYCSEMKVGDWKATIENPKRETTQDFFLHVCENSNIASWGTGKEYIRQLYTTINGHYMDRNDVEVKYYRAVLIHRFGHRPPNINGKPVLNMDNLRVILKSLELSAANANRIAYQHRPRCNVSLNGIQMTPMYDSKINSGRQDKQSNGNVEKS